MRAAAAIIIASLLLWIVGIGGVMAETPMIKFDPSQRRFFDDPARVIAVNWHRQKGKDFTAAAKAVNEAMLTGQDWHIVGLNQGQADETFIKCKRVVDAMKALLRKKLGSDVVDEESEEFLDYNKEIDEAFPSRRRILRLPNGARVVSLPGMNPDALTGRTGNLLFTEFGLLPRGGYDHWGTLFPITTRGGFKFLTISTPRGRNTKFYELAQNVEGFYSVHVCDIYRSVHEDGYQLYDAMGRPFPQRTKEERDLAIATFRRIYNDEAKWPREYECKFTGDLSALITWAELERAAALGAGLPFDFIRIDNDQPLGDLLAALKSEIEQGARIETGYDIARHGHLSSVLFNLARTSRPKHLRFNAMLHECSFAYQRDVVRAVMDLQRYSVGRGDATGLGMETNEVLERLFRDRWEGFTFTATGKREIASALKTAFADGTQTLPPMSGKTKYVATDIYAIQKDDSGAQLTLEETENPLLKESHCDVGYSLGLARVAGASAPIRLVSPPLDHVPLEYGL